jgi:hypothetical protein
MRTVSVFSGSRGVVRSGCVQLLAGSSTARPMRGTSSLSPLSHSFAGRGGCEPPAARGYRSGAQPLHVHERLTGDAVRGAICACAAVEGVDAGAAGEPVVARAAAQDVRAVAAGERVVAPRWMPARVVEGLRGGEDRLDSGGGPLVLTAVVAHVDRD